MSGDAVAAAKPTSTTFVNPDAGYTGTIGRPNPNFGTDKWYTTAEGSFEKRIAEPSVMDGFSGFNYNKIPSQPGEFYSRDAAPILKYEWDEEAYYKTWKSAKSDEQVAEELALPLKKMEEKWDEVVAAEEDGVNGVQYTPTMEYMRQELPQARPLQFALSPFFQLNSKGYRKNWVNTRISEYRPAQRFFNTNSTFLSDYIYRFQVTKFNLTHRPRGRYFKFFFYFGVTTMIMDHLWAHEFRTQAKWH